MAIPVAAPQRPAQVHAPHHASENREGQVDEVSNRDNGAGSHPCPIGRPTPARSHERPTRLTSMPLERLPDLPRVVVPRIEGRDTLYEFDVSAAPSREWRAAFLWPPPG